MVCATKITTMTTSNHSNSMRVEDLLIAIAYFSIPVQIVISISCYPRLAQMPLRIVGLLILFALFIFLCGTGHVLKCMDYTSENGGRLYDIVNWITAVISCVTALYLLPMIPNLMSSLDEGLENLRRLNEETEASKRKLMTFMAFLCHEIRNPLFAITSNLTFLADEPLTNEQRRTLRAVNQSTNLMLRLVNDVLDISKLENGKIELEERDFDLRDLLQHVADNARVQVKKKTRSEPVQFAYRIDSSVPQMIRGDSVRILQIVYNLLSNATKFTEKGRIDFIVQVCQCDAQATTSRSDKQQTLGSTFAKKRGKMFATNRVDREMSAKLLRHGDNVQPDLEQGGAVLYNSKCKQKQQQRVVLEIIVSDTGEGISKDRLKTIFKPYTQCKLSDYRKHGGTGLGLSILFKLVQVLGGTIQVESTVGEGSKFVVHLSVAVSPGSEELLGKASNHLESDDVAEMFREGMRSSRLPSMFDDAQDEDEGDDEDSNDDREGRNGCGDRDSFATCQTHDSESSLPTSALPPLSQLGKLFEQSSTVPAVHMENNSPSPTTMSHVFTSSRIFDFAPQDNVILVTDDNAINRKLICRMLSHFRLEYQQAQNGQEAVEKILQSRNVTGRTNDPWYGLILMDLSMPVMTGCEAIRILRQQYKVTIPIVALTANAMEESQEDALDAGATEFATKPILRDDLYAICQAHLRRGSRAAQLQQEKR